ncbi:hypothetical protein PVAP13_8NG213616 [Panicum virgatum]|uniref:Uncharacterized protein n=1 Tax=Panicum virgatum TaxID=38727 RepID=A0A8T0PEI4_PANVG|nr:hypothetical protein PVAP13_8NG213616 [Panicum virgatum]KAG2557636.1 hypothetical protein PVAP13_8NG213616 [Panicum virgatum]
MERRRLVISSSLSPLSISSFVDFPEASHLTSMVVGGDFFSFQASHLQAVGLVLTGGDNEREHAGAAVTEMWLVAAYLRAPSRCHCLHYHVLSPSAPSIWQGKLRG